MKAFAITALFGLSHAWWDGAHLALCQIAKDELLAAGKGDVVYGLEKLLGMQPENWVPFPDWIRASMWGDQVHNAPSATFDGHVPRVRFWSPFHFVNLPAQSHKEGTGYRLEVMDATGIDDFVNNDTMGNIIHALNRVNMALINQNSNTGAITEFPNNRLFATSHSLNLLLLLHFIGDAHMPLHNCGLWNDKEHCRGGNLYNIQIAADVEHDFPPDGLPSNLHFLWDSMCLLEHRRWNELSDSQIRVHADRIKALFPKEQIQDNLNLGTSLNIIYHENYAICSTGVNQTNNRFIYQGQDVLDWSRPRLTINKDYIDWCRHAAQKRVAVAGYRLANKLDAWWRSVPRALKEEWNLLEDDTTEPPTEDDTTDPETNPPTNPESSPQALVWVTLSLAVAYVVAL